MNQSKQYRVEVSERAKQGLAKVVTYIAIENPNLARKIKAEGSVTTNG